MRPDRQSPLTGRAPIGALRAAQSAAGQDSTREDGPATAQADTGTIPLPGPGRGFAGARSQAHGHQCEPARRSGSTSSALASLHPRRREGPGTSPPRTRGRPGAKAEATSPAYRRSPARRPASLAIEGPASGTWHGAAGARRIIPLVSFHSPHTGDRAGERRQGGRGGRLAGHGPALSRARARSPEWTCIRVVGGGFATRRGALARRPGGAGAGAVRFHFRFISESGGLGSATATTGRQGTAPATVPAGWRPSAGCGYPAFRPATGRCLIRTGNGFRSRPASATAPPLEKPPCLPRSSPSSAPPSPSPP